MGLNADFLDFIESSIAQVYGDSTAGLRMLELGDQEIRTSDIPEETGKEYFTRRGYEHVSVDINGLHGAIVKDLTRPEQFTDWHHSWDILTNSGTTEHVEPHAAQYECFGILHDCLKVGGVAIHLLPDVEEHDQRGAWANHCRFFYSTAFFEYMAGKCGYELIQNSEIRGLRCVALKKTADVPFAVERSAFIGLIAQREPKTSMFTAVKALLKKFGVDRIVKRIGRS